MLILKQGGEEGVMGQFRGFQQCDSWRCEKVEDAAPVGRTRNVVVVVVEYGGVLGFIDTN